MGPGKDVVGQRNSNHVTKTMALLISCLFFSSAGFFLRQAVFIRVADKRGSLCLNCLYEICGFY